MPILVVHPETAWPLPWYFRSFERVGYFPNVESLSTIPDVPILIVDESFVEAVDARLTKDYVKTFVNLREDNMLILYMEQSVFDRLVDSRSK